MATIALTTNLDVLSKYTDLVTTSLDSESVYIRTKETIEEFFEKGNLKDTDKAQIISSVLSSLNTSLVNTSMSTALQWASAERELAFKKLSLEKDLDSADNELLIQAEKIKALKHESVAVQASTIRNLGTPTVIDGTVTALADTGKVYKDMQLVDQTIANKVKEGVILDAKKSEADATIHKLVADTYVNYGQYLYNITSDGLVSIVDNTPAGVTTLSDTQRAIGQEQAKGYAYNSWSSALVASSSTLGTALTSETASAAMIDPWLTNVDTLTAKMANIVAPVF